MIFNIIRFEIKSRFSQWTTLIFYLMLIFQGIWYTKGTFDYYVNEAVLMNAPAVFYKNFAANGILMIIMVAILSGTALYKDIENQTGQWAYTLPVNEKKFFLGRFFASYFINVLVALGYFLGMLLVPYAGIGTEERFGSTPIGQMVHGFLVFTVPNLFIMTSAMIAAIVYFRKMTAGYLALFLTVLLFLVLQSTAESSGRTPYLQIFECFGYVAVDAVHEGMNSYAKNNDYLSVSGYLLLNRLLWLAVGIFLFFIAYRKFSFKYFIDKNIKSKPLNNNELKKISLPSQIINPALSFTWIDFLKKLYTLAILEFKNVVRPAGFKVILLVIMFMVFLQNILWNANYYIGPAMPLTSHMTIFRLTFGVFIMVLLMIWSGELFFKDKTVKIWQITDALPVPVWVSQLSKWLAMAGVALIFALSFMALGVIAQILQGGFALIDLSLYAYDILGFNWGWLTYILEISLVFFIAGLTGNRYLTHVISIGIYLFIIISFELGLAEQTIFAYAAVPGLEDYSDISGYGIWKVSAPWYFLMWAVLALVFVLLGILFWQRGAGQHFLKKLTFTGNQLHWAGKLSALVAIGLFLIIQSFIIHNVSELDNFKLSEIEEEEAANYEKKYSFLKTKPQPKYSTLFLQLDYFTQERKAIYKADILLKNTSYSMVDTLYLDFEEFVSVEAISLNNTNLSPIVISKEDNLLACVLPRPLFAKDSLLLTLQAHKAYRGFTQSGEAPQADLMFEGSFGSIKEFLPTIGYNYEREITENRKRTEQNLAKLTSRMAPLTDTLALMQDAYAPDATWVKGKIILSTDKGQTAYSAGQLTKEWEEGTRAYFQYEISTPAPFEWYMGSATFAVQKSDFKGVSVKIMSSPKHLFNVSLYQNIIQKSIAFIEQNLGNYPYQELRLVEIPYYQGKFFSFPNTIAISEKEGWVADTTGMKEKAYLYQSVASQVIKHWIHQNIQIANVQGADMLRVALPEALALQVVKQSLGKDGLAVILQKKKDLYGKDRNQEPNQEPSLLYADGIEYLEANKGAIALYQIMEEIGQEKLISALRNHTNPLNFASFYQQWKSSIAKENRSNVEEVELFSELR
jgi:ABC-type transport system involved in multi-copper enzyme maturation permease subunit